MSAGESGSYSQSRPQTVSPFGQIPTQAAGRYMGGFATPYSQGIGHGNVGALSASTVPAFASLVPQATALGGQVKSYATQGYSAYQDAVDSFLNKLPGYQDLLSKSTSGVTGPGGTDDQSVKAAQQMVNQSFDPTQSNSLFQNTAQQATSAARTTEAARGLLDAGSSGAAEQQNILTPLANQFAQSRFGNEATAQGALQGAGASKVANAANVAGTGAGIAGMGPQAAQGLMSSLPTLINSLVTGMGLPVGAANSIIDYLTKSFAPLIGTAQVTAPTVAQRSMSMSQSTNAGV